MVAVTFPESEPINVTPRLPQDGSPWLYPYEDEAPRDRPSLEDITAGSDNGRGGDGDGGGGGGGGGNGRGALLILAGLAVLLLWWR